VAAVLIGATMNETDLPAFKTMLVGNNIMRIFPRDVQVALGKTLKVLPAWTNMRFTYCQDNHTIPFVSTKVDGDPDGLAYVRAQLLTLPSWITQLYITDRHEPEADVTAGQFVANFNAFLKMVDSLPPELRRRIRCGPVLTKTWTDKAGRTLDTYDPGTGDFFGLDAYVASGTANTVVTPATLPDPATFLAGFKAYKKTPADTRDRILPEQGVIGMPEDLDGAARAGWIRGIHTVTRSWTPAGTGWKFLGFIWWNSEGKATGLVAEIGQRRDFPLHLRTAPAFGKTAGALATAVTLPGNPPLPVAAYNAIFQAENPVTVPDPGVVPAPVQITVRPGSTAGAVAVDVAVNGEQVYTTQIEIR
jgi:hypothetical protein